MLGFEPRLTYIPKSVGDLVVLGSGLFVLTVVLKIRQRFVTGSQKVNDDYIRHNVSNVTEGQAAIDSLNHMNTPL